MGENQCSRVILASGILACLVLSISIPAIATPPALITDFGKSLASVFEGLKANPQFANYQRRPWRGSLQSRLPGLRNANIIMGNYCPVSSCEGNYAMFVDNPGGCASSGCDNVSDFVTDVAHGDCYTGARDSECGGGDSGPCCANWIECPATNTIGCPKN